MKTNTRTIPQIDSGNLPIWKLDQMAVSELVWRNPRLTKGDTTLLPWSLFMVLRIKDQIPEVFRKLYPTQIRPSLTPEMLVEAGIVADLGIFQQMAAAMARADSFARQSMTDMLCYNLLVDAARTRTGEDKRRIIRLGFNFADWSAELPKLDLKLTDLANPNDVVGTMYDHVLTDDYLLGFDFRDVQYALAKKWPWRLCADCGVQDGCECGEIKSRERTGNFVVEVEVDGWQATEQSLVGLAVQMNDQYHPKNLARGVYYELHRAGIEHVEFASKALGSNHQVLASMDRDGLMKESTDRRIWMTVASLALQLNLYRFLVARYERMAEERKHTQEELGGDWSWNGSYWMCRRPGYGGQVFTWSADTGWQSASPPADVMADRVQM